MTAASPPGLAPLSDRLAQPGPMQIDHLAITCASLPEGAAWVEERLGLSLDPGGRHDRFGTHNRLLSLGPDLYLEVIAPDPEAPAPDRPRWFALDEAQGPHLATWVARVPDLAPALAKAPPDCGEPLPLARGDLRWTIAVPPDGSLPWGGAFPTLIQWAPGPHPSERLPDRGLRLLALELGHPRARRLQVLLADLGDPRVTFVTADAPSLRARLQTPNGEVTL